MSEPSIERLCWWRDPPNNAFDGLPTLDGLPKATDPETRYRYERAHAETLFQDSIKELAGTPQTFRETNLGNCIGAFLHNALSAFADFLMDKATPAPEALREFDQHADQLLNETFLHKWLYGLRLLSLVEDEPLRKQFWSAQNETARDTRHAFEALLWKAELKRAESSVNRVNQVNSNSDSNQSLEQEMGTQILDGAVNLERMSGASVVANREYVDLYRQILQQLTLETFLGDNRGIARTSLMDYLAGRIAGKVSKTKCSAIEAAIHKTAEKLGLLTRTDSN